MIPWKVPAGMIKFVEERVMTLHLAAQAMTSYLAAPGMTIYLAVRIYLAATVTPYLAAPALTMWMVVLDLTFAKREKQLRTVRLGMKDRKPVGGGV
jgi:hypothetical protein